MWLRSHRRDPRHLTALCREPFAKRWSVPLGTVSGPGLGKLRAALFSKALPDDLDMQGRAFGELRRHRLQQSLAPSEQRHDGASAGDKDRRQATGGNGPGAELTGKLYDRFGDGAVFDQGGALLADPRLVEPFSHGCSPRRGAAQIG